MTRGVCCLTNDETNETICALCRIESYSMKMVQNEKRLFSKMLKTEGPDTGPNDRQPLSPPIIEGVWPPFAGPSFAAQTSCSTSLSPGAGGQQLLSPHQQRSRSRHRSASASGGSDQELALGEGVSENENSTDDELS